MDDRRRRLAVAAVVAVTVAAALLLSQRNRRRRRSVWTRPWIERRNSGRGTLNMVQEELLLEDRGAFQNFLRMSEEQFQTILNVTRRDYERVDTLMRGAISADKRLALTLRFLATGESFRSLMYSTRIHETTIGQIVPEVCVSIYRNMKAEYLKVPSSAVEWVEIAHQFESLWGFPMCLGAMDGKHILFQPPASAGSYYYNYKGGHSIVLLAVADARYKFIYVDVGVNGRVSDGGVFRESSLAAAIARNLLQFPANKTLPGRDMDVPFVFVADDAFPLTDRIMKPFPFRDLTPERRQYNYHLSRARRVVENAFGILSNRFRIFLTTINLAPEKVETVTLAAVTLHNFLCGTNVPTPNAEDVNALPGLLQQGGNRPGNLAYNIRNEFCSYFNSLPE